jgi:hypothetical protein
MIYLFTESNLLGSVSHTHYYFCDDKIYRIIDTKYILYNKDYEYIDDNKLRVIDFHYELPEKKDVHIFNNFTEKENMLFKKIEQIIFNNI